MPGNHKIAPSNESPRTPSVVSSHSWANASHPKANIRLRVRIRHITSARKYVILGRKRTLVKDYKKSLGESCVWSPTTLYTIGFFQKKLRQLVCFSLRCCRKSETLEFRNSRISCFGARSVGPPQFGWPAAVGVALR